MRAIRWLETNIQGDICGLTPRFKPRELNNLVGVNPTPQVLR
jgi:hypothetical protein